MKLSEVIRAISKSIMEYGDIDVGFVSGIPYGDKIIIIKPYDKNDKRFMRNKDEDEDDNSYQRYEEEF